MARLGWLAAEVVVVFLGVYAAFWLDGYRAEQREEERRQQIYETLYADVSHMKRSFSKQAPALDSSLVDPFITAYEKGEQPMPEPLITTGTTFDMGTWEAMLQSGGLDALDIAFVREVNGFFRGINQATTVAQEYERRSDNMILPQLNEGEKAFYDPETKRFKESYQWYPRSLRWLSSTMHHLQQETDSLHAKLEARMEEGE